MRITSIFFNSHVYGPFRPAIFRRELLRELFAELWVALYQVGAFTPAIVPTIAITMQSIVVRKVHAIVHA